MATNIHNLRIFHLARKIVREINAISADISFADMRSQITRAALSVVSNIAEGAGTNTDRHFRKHLSIALASLNEVRAQLLILSDLGVISENHQLHNDCDQLGAQTYCLIKRLDGA